MASVLLETSGSSYHFPFQGDVVTDSIEYYFRYVAIGIFASYVSYIPITFVRMDFYGSIQPVGFFANDK